MTETFQIGGTRLSLSKEDVEERLRDVLPERIRDLAVTIDGRQYPVKQAFAVATGLLRGNFTSHEAMRVFRRLSFPLTADSSATPDPPPRRSIFETTEELLCPQCNKPYVFRVSQQQAVFEGCSCPERKSPQSFPPNSIISWIGTSSIGFLRVPKKSA